MELAQTLTDYILHLDEHLTQLVQQYGTLTYAILFTIIFLETGVVVTPFLPGDSLLFAAGAVAGLGGLNVWLLFVLLTGAAILGDTVNYWIGAKVGPRVFREDVRFLKREHLTRTERFYEQHGGKTIFLARFVPIVRTFAPFVAGIGRMHYPRFLAYNVVGALVWCGFFIFAGYLFGNHPAVKENFSLVIIAIVLLSLVPIVWEMVASRRERRALEAEQG
jgi:membrane-associated protein